MHLLSGDGWSRSRKSLVTENKKPDSGEFRWSKETSIQVSENQQPQIQIGLTGFFLSVQCAFSFLKPSRRERLLYEH